MKEFLCGLFGMETREDRELRSKAAKIAYSFNPKPIKQEFEIMSHLVLDAEKYDDIGRIDLRDKTLTILREFIESINGEALYFKDEATTSNVGKQVVVFSSGHEEVKDNPIDIDSLIVKMIDGYKSLGMNPPYCLSTNKAIDISKYPEIEKIIIDEYCTPDKIYLHQIKTTK